MTFHCAPGIKLDKMSDSVTGQTVVNPRDFLTDLRSVTTMNDAEVSDIKKARTLLKSGNRCHLCPL